MYTNADIFQVPERLGNYTYRCKYCGQECVNKIGLPSGLSPTKTGSYNSYTVPTPSTYDDLMYSADTIYFVAATATEAAKIKDSALLFAEKHFTPEMVIKVDSDTGVNDGTYTIAVMGVTRGEISLSSSDTLITEGSARAMDSAGNYAVDSSGDYARDAGSLGAGTVRLYRVIYQPNVVTGCGLCGSLNSY